MRSSRLSIRKPICWNSAPTVSYTDRVVRIAERFPKTLIRVSLEGLAETNDRLRGTKDGFDHALRTMLDCARRNAGISDSPSSYRTRTARLGDLYDLLCRPGRVNSATL